MNSSAKSSERTLTWLTPRLFVGMLNDTTYELSSERTPHDVYSVLSEDRIFFRPPTAPTKNRGVNHKSVLSEDFAINSSVLNTLYTL